MNKKTFIELCPNTFAINTKRMHFGERKFAKNYWKIETNLIIIFFLF